MNLKLELAATIDVGEHFVKATYFLEGDGPLVFACYEKLSTVSQLCQAPCFLNVCAIAVKIKYQGLLTFRIRDKALMREGNLSLLALTSVDIS